MREAGLCPLCPHAPASHPRYTHTCILTLTTPPPSPQPAQGGLRRLSRRLVMRVGKLGLSSRRGGGTFGATYTYTHRVRRDDRSFAVRPLPRNPMGCRHGGVAAGVSTTTRFEWGARSTPQETVTPLAPVRPSSVPVERSRETAEGLEDDVRGLPTGQASDQEEGVSRQRITRCARPSGGGPKSSWTSWGRCP